mmetsp:Transcript_22603/g.41636  ORF Transcript_22603/g.41636 Transcript_22603/m.41636 type:complete len:232 (+) Transcript_22603:41-736(+)
MALQPFGKAKAALAADRQRVAAGNVLRSRLAAKADAALAAPGENPLKTMLLEEDPEDRTEKQAKYEAAVSLMLARPPQEREKSEQIVQQEEEEIDLAALHAAAEAGDLEALSTMDRRLRRLLDHDEQLQAVVRDGRLSSHPEASEALRLYRATFMYLQGMRQDAACPESGNMDKDAFQAVMRDDAVALEALVRRGVRLDIRNKGGQSMLQLAQERKKEECLKVLMDAGAVE